MNLLAVAVVLIAAAASAGFWAGSAASDRACELAARRETDAVDTSAANALPEIRSAHQEARVVIQKVFREKPVPSDCRTGPDSVRAFNSTIPPESSADRVRLPAEDAPGR